MSKWISVTDKLPRASEDVIVFAYNKVGCGYLGGGSGRWWAYAWGEPENLEADVPVTHWQPLPAPPEPLP